MKRQIAIVVTISILFGVSVGYFASLASSFKRSADAVPDLASALSKTDEFSDTDIAVMIRMFRLSESGRPSHTDNAAIWRLSAYYAQRSGLTPGEQHALGAATLLPKIEALQETNPELRDAITKAINKEENKSEMATPRKPSD